MSDETQRDCLRGVQTASAVVAAIVLASAVLFDRGVGGAVAGAAAGAAASFGILRIRVASVSRVLAAESRGEAGRSAFTMSLGKLALAFAALGIGAFFGRAGVVAALAGLMTTTLGTVFAVMLGARTGG
jgi:hypothetical protein